MKKPHKATHADTVRGKRGNICIHQVGSVAGVTLPTCYHLLISSLYQLKRWRDTSVFCSPLVSAIAGYEIGFDKQWGVALSMNIWTSLSISLSRPSIQFPAPLIYSVMLGSCSESFWRLKPTREIYMMYVTLLHEHSLNQEHLTVLTVKIHPNPIHRVCGIRELNIPPSEIFPQLWLLEVIYGQEDYMVKKARLSRCFW